MKPELNESSFKWSAILVKHIQKCSLKEFYTFGKMSINEFIIKNHDMYRNQLILLCHEKEHNEMQSGIR